MDYKELIEWLRHTVEHGDKEPREYCTNMCGGCEMCDQAATAIETLLAERDAAVEDSKKFADAGEACHLCKHLPCYPENDHCIGFEWRGPEKGDEQ